ncbi:zonadhesin [Ochotona curzoniae]|uniref:zonadhesin n=1 Tax=Ochotona curzoniae TaxID=130825 RepID=UPI001B348A13|nr:zonadhesin [Ochotona curzoniae]
MLILGRCHLLAIMAVLTQCDFEDDSRPLCDWSQVSADDGDWTRASGPSPAGIIGPSGGYPNGDGYYLHMNSNNFRQGGVARLRSPDLWEQGPLCVHFAYHMFGLSWGAQLRLLLLSGTQGKRPSVLWKHDNTESPSWMPTTVTMPAELALPSRLMFEATRGSTTYLDIALDALSIKRGTCNHICMMQMCNFDTLNDLCGWSWVPSISGAKWTQKTGNSGVPGVGPQDDYSSPGNGFYMLLDPKNAKPGQNSVLLSPPSQSAGCLTLSFHYVLWGQSPGVGLVVQASVMGRIRKHTLFTGQPDPSWQFVSVNYTGPGQIQFTMVGLFGDVPEPAVAVDAVSIAPCGESFPQCNFEDEAHPFCDWLQSSEDSGHWTWASKDLLIQDKNFMRDSPYIGHHYIYMEADSSSRPGQSVQLVSRPFCAPGDVCVEFNYHMYGLGEGTALQLLLGSPAGSTPVSLWNRVGSQSPDWHNASVTIPSGHQQPMQLVFEAIRGTNTAFVVAMSSIWINHGTCRGKMEPEISGRVTKPTEPPTVPTERLTVRTEQPTTPTEPPTVPTEPHTVPTELPTVPTELSTVPTEPPTVPTEPPTVPTEPPTVPTEPPTVPTEPPTVPTEQPTVPTEQPTVPTEPPTVPTEPPTVPTEQPTVATEQPTVPTEPPTVPTEPPTVPTEPPTVATEPPTVPTEPPTVPTEPPTVPTEPPTVPTEPPTVHTEPPTVPTEPPTVPTEPPTVPTEQPTVATEPPTVPTEPPTVATEPPTVPTEPPTVATEPPTVPTEPPTVPTEPSTVPTEQPTVLTEPPTVPTEPPTVPTEPPTVPTEPPTVPTEPPTVPTEPPTVPTEPPTIPTEPPTVPTEPPTVPTEPPTVPTEPPTVPTEPPTVPTEQPTVPTEPPTVPTEPPTILTEPPTVPTELSTVPTEQPTVATELSTVPTEPPTVATEPPTIPTEPPTLRKWGRPDGGNVLSSVSCPLNTHYESCACLASCEHPQPSCQSPCQPGCVCDPGLVFSRNSCINASSCQCVYNNNEYKPGAEWFSPNCTEHCRCWPGSRVECQVSQCKTHTKCQLKDGQYGCYPYGTATCFVYGDPHYVTFDGRPFGFMGTCTYILAQPCNNSTDAFFRVTAKNEERGQEGMSCLSRVDVTLPETTITLLKGRHTLVGGQRVTLPAMPSSGVFLGPSGRFVELQTAFGLRLRWDGDRELFVTVSSTYFQKLCGLCGNYDGSDSNDNLKPDGQAARSEEELGSSWQTALEGDKEQVSSRCQKNQAKPPFCDNALETKMLGPQFCGQLVDSRGLFEMCLLHLKAPFFFGNCVFDLCNFQGLQLMLCAHLSTLTATCQDAGYAVKPWRKPQFCPLACPPNSRYSLCTTPCPKTCHSGYTGMSCPKRCVEGCECNPGFILSGLECVPQSQCGCLDPSMGYFKVREQWYKSNCTQLCICENNNKFHCQPWKCGAQEECGLRNGIYGCHAQRTSTCTVSGDPHYLTFDGALHHFMGTCNYVLAQPCRHKPREIAFVVSATNENRGGNMEVSYVRAVHLRVFDLKISLVKGRKVMLNGRQVALPVWPSRGQVIIRPSGNFILLYTNFGLQIRYDGNHLVQVTVPSSYAGRLCGLCGNYNNNSLDDNLRPNQRPASNSLQLGAAWKLEEGSEPGCFIAGGKPSSCKGTNMGDMWNKNCEVLRNPVGPFSQCHSVVPPKASFISCVHGQCGTKGDGLTLCRSLQAYAALCAQAGQPLGWRNSTFCPLKCPPNSNYNPCSTPCPATCLSLNVPKDCPVTLTCTEGCECQKGYVLSGTSCVLLRECGCMDTDGSYHSVGESWYTDNTCTKLCTCSLLNNITCQPTTCKAGEQCWPVDGLLRCRASGMGVCRITEPSQYIGFDGISHPLQGTCTYVMAQVCHPNMDLPFFKVSAKNEKLEGRSNTVYLRQVYIDVSSSLITLQKGNSVLVSRINGNQVSLPVTNQIPGVSITSSSTHTMVSLKIGAQIKFDGRRNLEIIIPAAYYEKMCGICGNYNGEPEDELLMSSDELADNDLEFVKSWKDNDIDRDCQKIQEEERKPPVVQQASESRQQGKCGPADFQKAKERCQAALHGPGWAECATRVDPKPLVLGCSNNLCQLGGLLRPLCEALKAFGTMCQNKGLKPPLWRNSTFCRECPPDALECSAYSTYTNCLPTCSPSCWDLDGRCEEGAQVPSTCAEGCICKPGYVLSEDKCVPRSQCSCKDTEGGFIPPGKSWMSKNCNRKCTCNGGVIQCHAFHCPARSHCQLNSNSDSYCAPDKSDQCTIFGDPHYRTFDGANYIFQGRMTYALVKTVDTLPDGVEPLLVEGRNKVFVPHTKIFVREITTFVYGYKVQLRDDLLLVVNNQKMAVPYRPEERLRVTLRGQRLYLITDFDVVISLNDKNNAVITLPSMYQGLVRGLCGTYDQNRKNEYMLPSGALTTDINVFGNSWELKLDDSQPLFRSPRALREDAQGEEKEPSSPEPECSQEQLTLANNTQNCGVLIDSQGPFAACHQTVDPKPFHKHCLLDLCVTQDQKVHEELRCRILGGYGILCQEMGIALASWRDHTHCAMVCPANTVYQSCMTPCPASCAKLLGPQDCEGPCVEGCASLPGYAFSGAHSLSLADCGCTSNGVYYQLGHSFVTADCSQRCTCASSGVLLCEPFSCRPGEICTLGNLTRGCFQESPCLQNPCWNDGRCREQGASFTCDCEPGYGGNLCTEPREIVPRARPDLSNLVAVMLGLLASLAVLGLVAIRKCVSKKKRRLREKTKSSSRDWLLGTGDHHSRRSVRWQPRARPTSDPGVFKTTQF